MRQRLHDAARPADLEAIDGTPPDAQAAPAPVLEAASVDDLVAQTRPRLEGMLAHGTTTVEVKTGYGLNTQVELKQLSAIWRLQVEFPATLVSTFLGAHAIPAEYQGQADQYVALVTEEMLPAAAAVDAPPAFCDVFCEDGAFTLEVQCSERSLPLSCGSDHIGSTDASAASLSDRYACTNRTLAGPAASLAAGLQPAELQIDFDCAESALDEYRIWLEAMKEMIHPIPLTLTVLPCWLKHSRSFGRLVSVVDSYVLQVHSFEPPQSEHELLASPPGGIERFGEGRMTLQVRLEDLALLGGPFASDDEVIEFLRTAEIVDELMETLRYTPAVTGPIQEAR